MKGLRARVDRIFRKTHAPVATEDWRVLADYYLERLKEDDIDPEEHRAESDDLFEKFRSLVQAGEKGKYQCLVNEYAANNRAGYFAHMYFGAKRMADSPIRITWAERDVLDQGFSDRVREIRAQAKARKRST